MLIESEELKKELEKEIETYEMNIKLCKKVDDLYCISGYANVRYGLKLALSIIKGKRNE